jgi:hypothetical protein
MVAVTDSAADSMVAAADSTTSESMAVAAYLAASDSMGIDLHGGDVGFAGGASKLVGAWTEKMTSSSHVPGDGQMGKGQVQSLDYFWKWWEG